MPMFSCPIEPLIGPGMEEVQARSSDWVRRLRLVTTEEAAGRVTAMRFGELASRAYPRAGLDDRTLISGWLTIAAVLTYRYDTAPGSDSRRTQAMFRTITTYLRTGRYPRAMPLRWGRSRLDRSLHHAIADLWQRTANRMPATWRSRFAYSASTFLDGLRIEAEQRRAGRFPTVEAYLRLRRATSAQGMLFDLIQLGTRQPLADAVHFHPSVDLVRNTAIDVVAWINDLASMAEEERTGGEHNLVLVLRRSGRLSTPLAQAVATDMINDGIRRLWQDAAELPKFGGGLPAYISGLKYWVRASIDWSANGGRYAATPAAPAAR